MEADSLKNKNKLRVLIADDDTPTRILLRAAVSQWGYEVLEAKDGEDAWEVLQTHNQPELLILDWLMPKLDGIALCARIREQTNYYPYIILLTQVTGSTNIVKGLEAGANEFLSKPFNMAELRSRLSTGKRMIEYDKQLESVTGLLQTASTKLNTYAQKLQTISDNGAANAELTAIQKDIQELAEQLKTSPNDE